MLKQRICTLNGQNISLEFHSPLPEKDLNTREDLIPVYCTESVLTWLKLAFKSLGFMLLLHTWSPVITPLDSLLLLLITCDYLRGQVVEWQHLLNTFTPKVVL